MEKITTLGTRAIRRILCSSKIVPSNEHIYFAKKLSIVFCFICYLKFAFPNLIPSESSINLVFLAHRTNKIVRDSRKFEIVEFKISKPIYRDALNKNSGGLENCST